MLDQIKVKSKVVGTKQTLKMVKGGKTELVYLARDVDKHILQSVEDVCKDNNIEIYYVDSMKMLGEACGIDRKAATVAILKDMS